MSDADQTPVPPPTPNPPEMVDQALTYAREQYEALTHEQRRWNHVTPFFGPGILAVLAVTAGEFVAPGLIRQIPILGQEPLVRHLVETEALSILAILRALIASREAKIRARLGQISMFQPTNNPTTPSN